MHTYPAKSRIRDKSNQKPLAASSMAFRIGFVVIMAMIAMTEALTAPCVLSDLVGTYRKNLNDKYSFTTKSLSGGQQTLMRTDTESGAIIYESQMESCGITQIDNKDGEVILSFKVVQGANARYCYKTFINNYVQFYVEWTWNTGDTGFTVDQCFNLLKATTSYNVLVQDVAPIPGPVSNPFFNNVIFDMIKAGTYRLEKEEGRLVPGSALQCASNTVTQSYLQVTSTYLKFVPCNAQATSYDHPYGVNLYVIGFVRDESLSTASDSNQVNGGFVTVVYNDGSGPFKYIVFRVAESVSSDPNQETYLQITSSLDMATQYAPVGYVSTQYVPNDKSSSIRTYQVYSELCLSDPCLNQGTCVDQWMNFTCICVDGFTGFDCSQKENECANQPSAVCNNGKCEDTTNGYTCDCNDGFTGPSCLDATDCKIGSCQNGGECVDYDNADGGNYYCDCPDDTFGLRCEYKKPCSKQPCKNGAECYDWQTNDDYTCHCVGDWTGKNCDQPLGGGGGGGEVICVENAATEICQNDGTCVDGKCKCPGFYVGKFCEEMNPWFIGSIVLIVLLAVIMITTLIICCFFYARGRTLGADGEEREKEPYNVFDRNVPNYIVDAGNTSSFAGYNTPRPEYATSNIGFTSSIPGYANNSEFVKQGFVF